MPLETNEQVAISGRFNLAMATLCNGVPVSTAIRPFIEEIKKEYGIDGESFVWLLVGVAINVSNSLNRAAASGGPKEETMVPRVPDESSTTKLNAKENGAANGGANTDQVRGGLQIAVEAQASHETTSDSKSANQFDGTRYEETTEETGPLTSLFSRKKKRVVSIGDVKDSNHAESHKSSSWKWRFGVVVVIVICVLIATLLIIKNRATSEASPAPTSLPSAGAHSTMASP